MLEQAHTVFVALLLTGLLGACVSRASRAPEDPIIFMGADTRFMSGDLVEVNASVIFPTEGVVAAYSDCVAARYALERGKNYVSRVLWKPSANGDIVTERTTYLLSSVAPDGASVLNARQILAACKANKIPTE